MFYICIICIFFIQIVNLKGLTAMETFKRKKTELNWEIYNTDQINKINQLIVEVRDAFQKVGLPKMPFYLKEAKETRHDVL